MSSEEFVQASSPRLFRTALLLTGHDRAAAEDLLQVALERAYRHWALICRSDEPERYVRRILANASRFNFHNPDGTLKAVPLIVLLQDNVTVSVEPTATGQPYLRFLPGFNATDEYTLSDGLLSATFTACPARTALFGQGLTEYYLGVVVVGPRCITIDVRTSASQPPYRAGLSFGRCGT